MVIWQVLLASRFKILISQSTGLKIRFRFLITMVHSSTNDFYANPMYKVGIRAKCDLDLTVTFITPQLRMPNLTITGGPSVNKDWTQP